MEFLTRPRYLGKTSLLAMLETYYGIEYAKRFEGLFGGTRVQSCYGTLLAEQLSAATNATARHD